METIKGIPIRIYKRRKLLARKHNPERLETHVPIECPICGFERWLKLHDARNALVQNRPCQKCSNSEKGIKGARVLHRRYGRAGFLKIIQKAQLAKPSMSEIQMAELLDEVLPQGFTYTEQEIFYDDFIIDFVIYHGESVVVLVEVNGYWHRRNEKQLLRDERLQLTSLIPVEFIDAELTDTHEGNIEIIRVLSKHIESEAKRWQANMLIT